MMDDRNIHEIHELEDKALSQLLSQVMPEAPPSDFVKNTTARFERARMSRFIKQMIAGGVAIILVSSPLIWWMLLNFKSVAKVIVDTISALEVSLKLLLTIWSYLPELSSVAMIAMWTLTLTIGVMLARMWKEMPTVK